MALRTLRLVSPSGRQVQVDLAADAPVTNVVANVRFAGGSYGTGFQIGPRGQHEFAARYLIPASPDAASTTMLTDLKATRTRQRAVLRGVALDTTPGIVGGRAQRAETSPGGLWGWDRNDRTDAYPSGYDAGFERGQLGAESDQPHGREQHLRRRRVLRHAAVQPPGAWAKVHEVFFGFLGSMTAARLEAV
jgi:hypothetical protein